MTYSAGSSFNYSKLSHSICDSCWCLLARAPIYNTHTHTHAVSVTNTHACNHLGVRMHKCLRMYACMHEVDVDVPVRNCTNPSITPVHLKHLRSISFRRHRATLELPLCLLSDATQHEIIVQAGTQAGCQCSGNLGGIFTHRMQSVPARSMLHLA